jgi:hypothetical protein
VTPGATSAEGRSVQLSASANCGPADAPAEQGGILGSGTPVIRLEPSISTKSLLIRAQSGNVISDSPIFLP